jgi:hypothetical protein
VRKGIQKLRKLLDEIRELKMRRREQEQERLGQFLRSGGR